MYMWPESQVFADIACCSLFITAVDYTDAAKILYQNGYDRPLKVTCSDGKQGINRIRSSYSRGHGDRVFQFYCSAYSSSGCSVCKTTPNYINKRHQHINYNCPANQVLSGVESVHYNSGEDRTWKFRCCESLSYVTANCELTPFINNFHQNFDYTIPGGKVMVGIHSFWRGK